MNAQPCAYKARALTSAAAESYIPFAAQIGFEPISLVLTGRRSTIELPGQFAVTRGFPACLRLTLLRRAGNPHLSDRQSDAQPLNYATIVDKDRVERSSSDFQSDAYSRFATCPFVNLSVLFDRASVERSRSSIKQNPVFRTGRNTKHLSMLQVRQHRSTRICISKFLRSLCG